MKWRSYSSYSDRGKIWLGVLPDQWEIKRIKHTTYVKGRIGWQGLRSDEFIDEGPFLITGTDFLNGRVNWQTCYHVAEERYAEDPYIQIQEDDLLVTKDGTIGKIAIARDVPAKTTLNSGIFLTRQISGHCLTGYIYWVLNSKTFTSFIDYTKAGSTISHLYQNVFVEFAFPLPSLQEQRTIATFLDRETVRIDTLISKKERQIELLQEKRSALISHAVTKGLDSKVKMNDSGIEWLGEIPEHWTVGLFKRVAEISYGMSGELDRTLTQGMRILSLPNVDFDGNLVLNEVPFADVPEAERPKLLLRHGDLLFNWRNGSADHLGKTAYFDAEGEYTHVSFLLRLRFDLEKHDSRYFQFLLSGFRITGFFSSSKAGVNNTFNQSELANLWVISPPLAEQTFIAQYLQKQIGAIRKLVMKIQDSANKLREYRSALITAAVTGKIDVRQEVT